MQQFAQMGFPEMYEQALVPALFKPWAEQLVSVTDVGPGDRVLDVACGTGIVAREARKRTGAAGAVVGVDLNPGMLAVARQSAPEIDWREGDAVALPLREAEQFDVVLCQQGLQFVADRSAAAAGMYGALRAGGRLGVSTWRPDGEMPALSELRHIAEKHVGPIADRRHSFGDAEQLETLLTAAGFTGVRVERITRTIHFGDGAAFIHLNAMALVGMSSIANELDAEARAKAVAAIAADSQHVLEQQTDDAGFYYEISANVATASR